MTNDGEDEWRRGRGQRQRPIEIQTDKLLPGDLVSIGEYQNVVTRINGRYQTSHLEHLARSRLH